MSDESIVHIVNTVASILTALISAAVAVFVARLNRQTAEAAIEVKEVKTTLQEAAVKVAEVKEVLKEKSSKDDEKFASVVAKVETITAKVEEVNLATNGMKAELVEEVRKASFAQGVKSEMERKNP